MKGMHKYEVAYTRSTRFRLFPGWFARPPAPGVVLSLQIAHGLTRARQAFLRVLKIGLFLALSVFGVALLVNMLYMFLV